jgi:hypothetical protein
MLCYAAHQPATVATRDRKVPSIVYGACSGTREGKEVVHEDTIMRAGVGRARRLRLRVLVPAHAEAHGAEAARREVIEVIPAEAGGTDP